jgi:shikimate dehydrogenase
MHNAAFKELGVDATYQLFPLQENELTPFFKALKENDSPIFGLNVTVPYKEKVIPYLDSLSPLAQKVGAVNTISVVKNRKLIGYNTDAPGFMSHLAELKVDVDKKRVAVLGAGGSAKAILVSLCLLPQRPHSIKIYNRTFSRAVTLVQELQTKMNLDIVEVVQNVDDLNIELADILINTTSLGLKPDDPCPIDPQLLHPNLFVYDLIYNPAQTLLLRSAQEKGARVSNGLGMLYYQGVLAFQHWAEDEIDSKVKKKMREALEKGLSRG